MERLFIVSNRLPVTVNFDKNGEEDFTIVPSVGGLATGMKSIYKQYESTWFG